jgi:hypothetical protein
MDTFRKAVKKALENSTDNNTDIGIGDMVEFKVSVKNYYPGSVEVPTWVKNDYYHRVTHVDRKIELTLDRQIKLTHLVIKSPLRGGGKRGGQHVQMAAYQGPAHSRGRHQTNSQGCWGVQEYRQEVPERSQSTPV